MNRIKWIGRILFILLFSVFSQLSIFSQTVKKASAKKAKFVRVAKKKTIKKRKKIVSPNSNNTFTAFEQTGWACIYSNSLHGTKTANGERFDKNKLTAAHLKLPIGSIVRVTSLLNGKSVDLRINDRGPFSKKYMLDMSPAAARSIGLDFKRGKMKIKVERIK
jgi:rare lipoprotein A